MDTGEVIKKTDDIENEIQTHLFEKFNAWMEYEIGNWRWWLGLGLTVLPWIVFWYSYRKKSNFDRMIHVCFSIIILSVFLDTFGDQYGLWHYRYNVVAAVPTYFPWDFTLMPLSVVMLLIYKPNVSPWIKGIIFALLSSFVGEPIFRSMDVYSLDNWKYVYSVPIQFFIYLFANWLYTTRTKFSL